MSRSPITKTCSVRQGVGGGLEKQKENEKMDRDALKKVRKMVQEHPEDAEKLSEAFSTLSKGMAIEVEGDDVEGDREPSLEAFTEQALKQADEQEHMQFRDWYVNQLTTCFGDELSNLRQSSDAFAGTAEDLSGLIDAMRTGESKAVFDKLAKSAVVKSINVDKSKKA